MPRRCLPISWGLEQQTAQLNVVSERFSFQEETELPGLTGLLGAEGDSGDSSSFTLLIAGKGEASITPSALTATAGLFGLPAERVRQIGETLYTYDREASKIDGRRPWVSSHSKGLQTAKAESLDPGGLLEGDHGGPQGTFSGLVQELNGALSVTESGPAIVDEQHTIEFDAELDPTPLLEKLHSKSTTGTSTNPLSGLGEAVSPGKHPAKASPPPSVELEVFIAPNGLPVRVRATLQAEGVYFSERVDTLAINLPVDIQAPPPSETIAKTALTELERRRQRRQIVKCRRVNLHRKHRLDCTHPQADDDLGSLIG